jgi:glycosyltransferase involved in cell wall biosynthesis
MLIMTARPYKIVFCTPALYSAGGVERIVSFKANYFAEQLGYDVTIIVTEGRGRDSYFPLSDKVKVINLELGFEDMWRASFTKKVFLYLSKQRQYKRLLKAELMRIRPDFTISMLRREINFLTDIQDGSMKIGELHVNRVNYRNFEVNDTNLVKSLFAKFWMKSLVGKLKRLDRLVVLTDKGKSDWPELANVTVIPDPIPLQMEVSSQLKGKRVVAIGRYAYQKGYDILLHVWSEVEKKFPDWSLSIYGMGNRSQYSQLMKNLGIDAERCQLNGPVNDVSKIYEESSVFVLSSRFEGFGLVLAEAMSCGVPVVSFDCPYGPSDIITDGVDGFLIKDWNVKAFADKVCLLMEDADMRQQMGRAAIDSSRRYQPDRIILEWQKLFESLCSKQVLGQ